MFDKQRRRAEVLLRTQVETGSPGVVVGRCWEMEKVGGSGRLKPFYAADLAAEARREAEARGTIFVCCRRPDGVGCSSLTAEISSALWFW